MKAFGPNVIVKRTAAPDKIGLIHVAPGVATEYKLRGKVVSEGEDYGLVGKEIIFKTGYEFVLDEEKHVSVAKEDIVIVLDE